MREHFGVSLRAKTGVAAADELLFKRLIIFDHTVVHEREFTTGVEVRVCVFIGHFSVRGPACVTDPKRPRKRSLRDQLGKCRNAAGTFAGLEAPSINDRNACGIVAAIFKTPQPVEQNGHCFGAANVANNSAHVWSLVAAVLSRNIRYAGTDRVYKSDSKKLPESADAGLLISSNAKPAAARFPFEESISSRPRATAWHNPTNACNHYGWRRWHAFVPANQRSRQARRASRGKISHRRYSHQQLPEFRASLDLCAHAIQQHVATSTYSSEL